LNFADVKTYLEKSWRFKTAMSVIIATNEKVTTRKFWIETLLQFFEICRYKNGFKEIMPPRNSDFCDCSHILITTEQVQRQNFDSDCFYSDFLNFIHVSFKIESYSI
jgi:hypothetical protein